MSRKPQLLRDEFGRFWPHTRAKRRGNIRSNSSDDNGSSRHGRKHGRYTVKIEAHSGYSSDSGNMYEVCKCGDRKVEGHRCSSVSSAKRKHMLIDLDAEASDIKPRHDARTYKDNLDENMDAFVAKVECFTASRNTQRRMTLDDKLDLVIQKLDALAAKVDGLTAKDTPKMTLADQLDLMIQKLDVVIEKMTLGSNLLFKMILGSNLLLCLATLDVPWSFNGMRCSWWRLMVAVWSKLLLATTAGSGCYCWLLAAVTVGCWRRLLAVAVGGGSRCGLLLVASAGGD
ncbi:hypothetical protein GUJ93_ZPchr0010g8485 [Zizania palustris]|uniref:Uncharacterized protein n=1 Tax=Zizania palustris TaxID=103762 RepID=A0A8J5TGY7_ZIZPA|nr:hypothetical protein GUJ93_ZPchr0010g8485 [Zizania palustris]